MKRERPDLSGVHDTLTAIMRKYEKGTLKATTTKGKYILAGPSAAHNGKALWFGAVCTEKNYVSYHLMPVYGSRELVESMSPALKKRMQGKACFNFTAIDETLFKELAALTARGYQRFKELKYLS